MYNKECIIQDNKICDECGECNFCDINPDKLCDNCGKCITGYDYSAIQVDDLIADQEDIENCIEEYNDIQWKFYKQDDNTFDNDTIFMNDIEVLNEIDVHDHHHNIHNDKCDHDHHHE